jgi:glycosyltransferase involved in cell wall biosynthesis
MQPKLILRGPINPLSLGNVTFNVARALLRKGVDVIFIPNANYDFRAYDSAPQADKEAVQKAAQDSLRRLERDIPALNIWHLNGAENLSSRKSFLFTFYETDAPTLEEKALVAWQDHVFFSSSYSADIFKAQFGLENVSPLPLGFDPDFAPTGKTYFPNTTIHFGLMGKWEKRKHTEKIIKMWIKEFGNKPQYKLTCAVDNPFFNPQIMQGLKNNVFGGQPCNNVSFINFMATNSLVNDFMNSIDIDLTGLSGAEGWNLPTFNVLCLGGFAVVLNATGHKDWATSDNCTLVNPCGKEDCYDEFFFKRGAPFNQGSIYKFDEEQALVAIKKIINEKFGPNKPRPRNANGVKLVEQFTWEKTAEKILEKIF